MDKLVFLKYFTCHNVHHPKTHSVVLFTSRKDLWRQLHLDMRLMRCWASAQHDIRYSILLFLCQEHLGQQVKISRRRKHSDYFRQVRCSIFTLIFSIRSTLAGPNKPRFFSNSALPAPLEDQWSSKKVKSEHFTSHFS